MASAGSIDVVLRAITDSFHRDMRDAADEMKGFSNIAEGIAKAAGAAFIAMGAGIGLAAKEFAEAERGLSQLESVARAMGTSLDMDAWRDFASEMQRTTGFTDDSATAAGKLLMTHGLMQGQVQEIIPLLADMASVTGMDLASAAGLLGRSVESGTNALARQGIVLTDLQQKAFEAATPQERLVMLADQLSQRYGGAAASSMNTTAGAFTALKNASGELAESIGGVVSGPLSSLVASLADSTQGVADWVAEFREANPELADFAGKAALGVTAFLGLTSGAAGLALVLPKVAAAFKLAFGPGTLAAIGAVLAPIAAIAGAIAGVVLLVGAMKKAWEADLGGIKGKTKDFVSSVSGWFARLASWLKEKLAGFFDWFEEKFILVASMLSGASPEEAFATMQASRAGGGILSTGSGSGASDFWAGVTDAVTETAGDAWGGIKESWSDGVGVFKDLLGGVMDLGSSSEEAGGKLGGLGQAVDALKSSMAGGLMGPSVSMADPKALKAAADEIAADVRNANIDQLFHDSFTGAANDLHTSLDDVGGFYQSVFNASAAVFGEQFTNDVADLALNFSAAVSDGVAGFAQSFGAAMSSKLGEAGQVASSIMQGMTAGPAGAVGAAFAEVLSRTESFQEILRYVSETFAEIAQSFDPLVQAVKPMVMAIGETLKIIAIGLGPIFMALRPVFNSLFYVMQGVGLAIGGVIYGIASVWNAILSAISWVFRQLADVGQFEIAGKEFDLFSGLDDWADSVDSAKAEVDDLADAMDELANATISEGEAIGEAEEKKKDQDPCGMGDIPERLDKAAESLTNAPAGYKVALARFDAMDAISPFAKEFSSGQVDQSTHIQQVVIQTNDPEKMWAEFQRRAKWANFAGSGSSQSSGLPNLVPRASKA